jgi:hypothetical protein
MHVAVALCLFWRELKTRRTRCLDGGGDDVWIHSDPPKLRRRCCASCSPAPSPLGQFKRVKVAQVAVSSKAPAAEGTRRQVAACSCGRIIMFVQPSKFVGKESTTKFMHEQVENKRTEFFCSDARARSSSAARSTGDNGRAVAGRLPTASSSAATSWQAGASPHVTSLPN